MSTTPDLKFMRLALRLARRGCGATSPNPMVGAVLVKAGRIIGRGWHHQAGGSHAEIEALRDAQRRGHSPRDAALYVTLEPCCTHGRTPPCTDAIIAAGIRRVIAGATDPNPKHAGKGFKILRRAGVQVTHEILAEECARLNEAFNHWIVYCTPFVTVKAAMTLDGKIATPGGESKWITGEKARATGMNIRQASDAIMVGVNTILADDPSLTVRLGGEIQPSKLRRIVLDSLARTPLTAKVVSDEFAALTTIVATKRAPKNKVLALEKKVKVLIAPWAKSAIGNRQSTINLGWLLKKLGEANVTSLLVEGGGEVNASFLLGGLAQRLAFFYSPKILGGRAARKSVAGEGAKSLRDIVQLQNIEWRTLGEDLFLTALVHRGGVS
ncbi:MAG TPA: bifunctional diaminohydroxyphosphoribosylaminopyrimidine deaminase/5-amino-6-(5-phosphoribosylamino)uracil reductase RibD [Verrucomicrobiae bacterium]|nr:bifunctional diaminohydroxyphosphoribosylaminopyrimidine deaminase/5-amino-6-(5-phosphoribosylamino)uracil reductase RibD [Verrucomicrobiae bacterium]